MVKRQRVCLAGWSWLVLALFLCGQNLFAQKLDHRQIPDEYEAVGGHALGLGNAGAAGLGGVAAARLNPALLPYESEYSVVFGYHWPSTGRDFYQMGIVDSVTSKVAAAFNYTNFGEEFKKFRESSPNELDSPLRKRAVLALAGSLSKISLGMAGQYVEGYKKVGGDFERSKGVTIGAGLSGLITPSIKFGLSAENLSNRKVKMFAPQYVRAGLGILMFEGSLSWQLDLQQRERIDIFENDTILEMAPDSTQQNEKKFIDPERMVINSFSVRFMNIVRLLASYGQAFSSDKRRSLSGSLGLVQNKFAISYGVSRAYWDQTATHQALDVNVVFDF